MTDSDHVEKLGCEGCGKDLGVEETAENSRGLVDFFKIVCSNCGEVNQFSITRVQELSNSGGDSSTNSVESERNAEGSSQENTRETGGGKYGVGKKPASEQARNGNDPRTGNSGNNKKPPKPDGVIMRYPQAVSDDWKFYESVEYGKLSENAERKKVFAVETIQNSLEDLRLEIREEDFTGASRQQVVDAVLERAKEVFSE